MNSCSSAGDIYRDSLTSCLQEMLRERGGQEKPNKGRVREREEELLDRKGRAHPRMHREEIQPP